MRVYESALPTRLKSTAAALAFIFANEEGQDVYPSIERIGWVMTKSARAARADIAELCKLGVLVEVTSRSGGRGRTTLFRFNADALPQRRQFATKHGSQLPPSHGWQEENPEAIFLVSPATEADNPEAFDTKPGTVEQETRKPTTGNPEAGFRRSVIDSSENPQEIRTAPQTARFSSQAKEPNGDNVGVITKLAFETMTALKLYKGEQCSELIEEVKQRCAELGIDYGRNDAVPFNVVHRACGLAQMQHVKAKYHQQERTA